jgi:hypothetical protein
MPITLAKAHRTLVAFGLCLFVYALLSLGPPAWAPAAGSAEDPRSVDTGRDQVTDSSSETDKVTEDAAEPAPQGAFDPALVGLPGFPDELATSAAFETALGLVEARLDVLRADAEAARAAPPTAQRPRWIRASRHCSGCGGSCSGTRPCTSVWRRCARR